MDSLVKETCSVHQFLWGETEKEINGYNLNSTVILNSAIDAFHGKTEEQTAEHRRIR